MALDHMPSEQKIALDFTQTQSLAFFLEKEAPFIGRVPPTRPVFDELDRNAIILHSSGSTGLPKPIYHGHKYLLNYAACHTFDENADVSGVSVSTLPLFHVSNKLDHTFRI